MPNAERIELIHQHGDGTYKLESIHVADVAHGDPAKNVLVEDNDIVAVYKNTEAQFIAAHQVRIEGEVVTPGFYPRGEGMRLTEAAAHCGLVPPRRHPNVEIAHARRSVDARKTRQAASCPSHFDTQFAVRPAGRHSPGRWRRDRRAGHGRH